MDGEMMNTMWQNSGKTIKKNWLIPFDPHEKLPDRGFLKIHCVQGN